MDNIYTNGVYTSLNPGFNDNESCAKAQALLALLRKNNICPTTILDFGCGGGGVLRDLSGQNSELSLSGVDINPDAIRYAVSMSENCNICFNTEFDSNAKYDLISFIHVLEHLPDWDSCLASVGSSSEFVYIAIPLEASVWHTFRPSVLKSQYLRYGHIHFFNKEYFLHRVRELGFEVIDFDFSDEFRSFKGIKASLISFPRRILGFFSKSVAANLLGGYCLQVVCKRIGSC